MRVFYCYNISINLSFDTLIFRWASDRKELNYNPNDCSESMLQTHIFLWNCCSQNLKYAKNHCFRMKAHLKLLKSLYYGTSITNNLHPSVYDPILYFCWKTHNQFDKKNGEKVKIEFGEKPPI